MNDAEYKNIFEHESNHFFYRATHDTIIKLIKRLGVSKKAKVLDVGCGTGLLVKKLGSFADAQGVDYHPNAIKFAKRRNIKIRKGSITKLPYSSGTFDIIVCIDVLCHSSINNDLGALQEMKRVLKPGGTLIVRVPAFQFLFSNHDRYVFTKKRYDYTNFRNLLTKSGLKPTYYSYMNLLLLLPTYLKRLIEKKSLKNVSSSVVAPNAVLNEIIYRLISLESHLMGRYIPLPFGIELLAVCTKASSR